MTHPAINTATRLLEAIVRGEHLTVWELLSPAGRDYVLETGGRRGLDPVQAARVRQGTSQPHERDRFLTSVLQGLRVDFSSVELEQVAPTGVHRTLPDGRVEVPLLRLAGSLPDSSRLDWVEAPPA
ncbi:MAG: hypothetical protein AAFN30_08815, partial [Actinomycetota bacterium]